MINALGKAIVNAFVELGPVKAVLSKKGTITIVAVGCIYAWTKEAMAEGWPMWVTVVGMIAVAIIAAAYVLGQALVDKADMDALPNVLEVSRRRNEDERRVRNGESGFLLFGNRWDAFIWSVLVGILGMACIALASGCSESADDDDVQEYTVTQFGDAIACFVDSVTQVPQLWGIFHVTNQSDPKYYDTEVRIVGRVCSPVTELVTVRENGVEVVKEVTIGENCTRQVLKMEAEQDTDCIEVQGGAQTGLDVYVYPLLWYPLELKDQQFPSKAGGTKTYSLVRNEIPSLIGEDQKVYPDCFPYYDECYSAGDCQALRECCDDPTVFENQEDVSTCALVNGGITQ